MSLNFCDLLVLGSDLSGVMAATLLAKRGMNILVLDDEEEGEPQPNLVTGLGSRGFKSLLGKLMIPDSRLQILHENKVACQIVFPRHRLDLYTSRPPFLKEVTREFPEEKGIFEDLVAEIDRLRENYLEEILNFLPLVGSRERKRFVKWFRNFPEEKAQSLWTQLSPTLQCLLKAEIRFLSRSPLMDPLILQLLLFLPPEGGATFTIRGGIRELKKLFYSKLDYFGSMVHPLGSDPYEILTKGRDVSAVQMSRYNFPTRCRYLLGNTNVQSLYQRVPSSLFSLLFNRTKKRVASLKPLDDRCLLQYHTSQEVLPGPMKENVVFISNPLAPLEGTNYLEINLQPLPKGGTNGLDTLLTVSFSLQGEGGIQEVVHPQSFQKIGEEIDARLRRLVPFSNSHLRRTFPILPAEESGLFPVENDFSLLEKLVRRRVAYPPSLFFPPLTSPFRNFFTVGPNVLEGFGTEGKMLTALRAIDLIWTRELKVKNP